MGWHRAALFGCRRSARLRHTLSGGSFRRSVSIVSDIEEPSWLSRLRPAAKQRPRTQFIKIRCTTSRSCSANAIRSGTLRRPTRARPSKQLVGSTATCLIRSLALRPPSAGGGGRDPLQYSDVVSGREAHTQQDPARPHPSASRDRCRRDATRSTAGNARTGRHRAPTSGTSANEAHPTDRGR